MAVARPMSAWSLPPSLKTRLQTTGPGLQTPFRVPPPRRKYMGGWRSLRAHGVAAGDVRGGNGAGDLEDPDEVVFILLAPADVVEGGGGVEVHGGPDAIGEDEVEAAALVHFIEVRQRAAGVEFLARGVEGWRTVYIVEQAFDQVGRGDEVLEALLVLDADGVAAELVGDAQGGDVHLALLEDLRVGEVGLLVGAGDEGDAAAYRARRGLCRLRRR